MTAFKLVTNKWSPSSCETRTISLIIHMRFLLTLLPEPLAISITLNPELRLNANE